MGKTLRSTRLYLGTLLIGLIVLALSASACGGPMLNKGQSAPDFQAQTFDGEQVDLRGLLQDGPLVLVFLRGFG
ncbi:MAG: hypothetical protein P9M14_01475 [Candidatus Alcyoniella australis]|nr:hypothetical protein [Candidatus Alcyoniella australis]